MHLVANILRRLAGRPRVRLVAGSLEGPLFARERQPAPTVRRWRGLLAWRPA